jgi:CHAT domain-containing protein
MTLVKVGRSEEAAALAKTVLARSIALRPPDDAATAEVRALAALASHAASRRDTAAASLAELRHAVEVLLARPPDEDLLGTTVGERDQRLRSIVGAYIDALVRQVAPATPGSEVIADAFRVADLVRGRVGQRALSAAAARSASHASGLAEILRQEHETAQRLDAAVGMLSTLADQPDLAEVQRARIARLGRARQALAVDIRRRVEREFPGFGPFVTPSPATVTDVQAALRPEESLIATFVTDERTYVWAVPTRGPAVFAVTALGRRELEQMVAALRTALDARARTLGDIPAFDVAAAHRLFMRLLEPVRAAWEGADTLVIVADGALAQLPFATLPTRPTVLEPERTLLFSAYRAVPWLGRSHAISTLPSSSALVTLRRAALYEAARRVGGHDEIRHTFIGFGDPFFSEEQRRASSHQVSPPPPPPADPRAVALVQRNVIRSPDPGAPASRLALLPPLPDTADEIRAIARTTGADPTRDVLLGVAANEHAVKTRDLHRYRIVAFATHGLVPGDLDGLAQPALALTAPEVANVAGDGLLTMQEVLELRLNADWVVLSACNTANALGVGAEGLSGLGRAFFYTGARALLVTHWPVETTSARALTTGLFERAVRLPWVSRAGALQRTMNALIDEGTFVDPASARTVFSYAHPIFWAPFALIGDGGR